MGKTLKKCLALFAVLCVAASPAGVLAGIAMPDFNAVEGIGTVEFSGKPDRTQSVSLSIFYPDAVSHSGDTLCWADQKETAADGKVNFSFAVESDSPSGWYTGLLKSNLEKEPTEFSFYYSNNAKEIVDEFNALTADNTAAFIEQYTVTTPVLKSDYEPNPGKDALAPYLFTLKEETISEKISYINALYNLSLALYNLNTAEDYKAIDAFLNKDNNIFNLDLNDDYNLYKKDICNVILDEINCENGLKSYKKLETLYSDTLVLTSVNSASVAGNINVLKNVIVRYAKKIGIDSDKYLEYDTEKFNRGLINKTYGGIDAFKSAYDARALEMDNEPEDDDDNNSGGGSGGGGSSKRSGSGTVLPANTQISAVSAFDDMAHVSWAKEAIEALAKNGIVNGYDKNNFCPDLNVTREQFVKMLVEAFNINSATDKCSFEDVNENEWYYAYVASAYDSGIVNGISDLYFGIGNSISRQDMAVMAYRCAVKCGVNFNTSALEFKDSDMISPYAKEAVSALVSKGIINGFEDLTFRPDGLCTRAEAAKVIYELMKQGV